MAELKPDLKRPKIAKEEDNVVPVFKTTALYSNWFETIFAPPAVLFAPFLVQASEAFSLGGLGHLLAHELWHGVFGDVTSGVSASTDTVVSAARLRKHACLAKSYKAAGGKPEAMEASAAENFADVMGFRATHSVYRGSNSSGAEITGFTPDQLFYIGTCFKWCSKEGRELGNRSRGHTPPYLRCNVPLMMMAEFKDAFSCAPDSNMAKYNDGNWTCDSPDAGLDDVTLDDSTYSKNTTISTATIATPTTVV